MGKTFTVEKSYVKRNFKKIWICCCDCQESFEFTAGEQNYYLEHHLAAPRRCKRCREYLKKHGKYAGLGKMVPGLYKGHFKGGIDVTDISGCKYKCYASNGYAR